jgi:3-oxoacyl-[acyl-carrier protein] reductase
MTTTTRRTLLALAVAAPAAAVIGSASAQTSGVAGPGAGRVALVTGSSRGIGAATARRLAREGYAVTVNCNVRRDLAAEVVKSIEAEGGRAIWHQADVADPAQVRALFDANDNAFGGVDVVISNAGIMNTGSFAEMEDADFDRMIATNVKGGFNVLREAARRTRDGGRIISLGSTIVLMTPPQCGPYAATKAVQDRFSSALAKELAGRRISVNAIAPGAVDTDLLRSKGTPEQLAGAAATTPYGRLGKADDIAAVIASLCSLSGEWINGQLVFANGGIA